MHNQASNDVRHFPWRAMVVGFTFVMLTTSSLHAEGKWKSLFDGKTLDGWKASEATDSFKVKDGAIVAQGKPRSHLFYVGDDKPFVNFEFEAEVMTLPGSNSGIQFHTKFQKVGWPKYGYEIQVNNTHGDRIKTGSLYAVANNLDAPAKDNEWFKISIKVEGKRVVAKVDGKLIIDYTEPDGKKPGKEFTRVFDKGTFSLQGHDPKSKVLFRNLRVRRLP